MDKETFRGVATVGYSILAVTTTMLPITGLALYSSSFMCGVLFPKHPKLGAAIASAAAGATAAIIGQSDTYAAGIVNYADREAENLAELVYKD